MAKSFKNGVSLHRLLEASPLAALEGFLATVDKGQYAAIFSDVQWASVLVKKSNNPLLATFDTRHQMHQTRAQG